MRAVHTCLLVSESGSCCQNAEQHSTEQTSPAHAYQTAQLAGAMHVNREAPIAHTWLPSSSIMRTCATPWHPAACEPPEGPVSEAAAPGSPYQTSRPTGAPASSNASARPCEIPLACAPLPALSAGPERTGVNGRHMRVLKSPLCLSRTAQRSLSWPAGLQQMLWRWKCTASGCSLLVTPPSMAGGGSCSSAVSRVASRFARIRQSLQTHPRILPVAGSNWLR